ncbi:MAG: hypothetical protein H7138_11350, partial [Myxococcales bacterium]|nr:hypothetical protein [Myxococcales bacterium]
MDPVVQSITVAQALTDRLAELVKQSTGHAAAMHVAQALTSAKVVDGAADI